MTKVTRYAGTSSTDPNNLITQYAYTQARTIGTIAVGDEALNTPYGVAVDAAGDIFIADSGNNVVREIIYGTDTAVIIAGTDGTAGYSGDGGAATDAELNAPEGLAIYQSGSIDELFIADTNNCLVRKVDLTTGVITTVAGDYDLVSGPNGGYFGDGGSAVGAGIGAPRSVAVDSSGDLFILFIADSFNNVIREVNTSGIISTVVGSYDPDTETGDAGYTGDGAAATGAELDGPCGIAVDAAGDLFIADTGNNVIREVYAATGYITTIAGNGTQGYTGDGGSPGDAELNQPFDVAVDAAGNLFIADTMNHVLREVHADTGTITTIAGTGLISYTGDGVAADDGSVWYPAGLALDASGNLLTVDVNNCVLREISGNALPGGLVTSMTDPNANVTSYVYNSEGLLTEVDEPYNTSVSTDSPLYVAAASVYYTYDTNDNPAAYTDERANTTYYTFDALDRKISETAPEDSDGNSPVTTWTYDTMGDVLSESDLQAIQSGTEVWATTNYTYNAVEELASTAAPGPNDADVPAVTSYTYTPTGLVSTMTDASGGITTYAYDPLGQETSVSLPDPATGLPGGPTSYTTYDPLGRTASQTDAMGNVTSYTYAFGYYNDYYGTLPGMTVSTTLPDPDNGTDDSYSAVTTDEYDPWGNLVSETTPASSGDSTNTTTYSYNAFNQPNQQSVDGGRELGPKYDKDGNVVSDTDLKNGYVTYYVYNALNELVQSEQPNATQGNAHYGQTIVSGSPVGPVTTYAYDSAGNLSSETDPMGNVTTWGYDNLNRETSVSLPNPSDGTAGGPTTTYSYDLASNRISTTSPSPTGTGTATTTNTYDLANNLLTTTDANDGVTSYTYDMLGNALSQTDPDGNTTSWTYDHLSQQTSQSQVVALGYFPDGTVNTTTATTHDFYDADGNLTTTIDADYRSISYAYDHLNEVTGETWFDASGNTTNTVAYAYDPLGDMLTAQNASVADSTSTPISDYTYQYDSSGNWTAQKVEIAGLTPDVILFGGYDTNGNLTGLAANIGGTLETDGTIEGGTNDFQDTFQFDPLGRMYNVTQTAQTVGTDNGVAPKNVALTYDNNSRLTNVDLYQSTGTSDHVASSAYGYDGDSQLTSLAYAFPSGSGPAPSYEWTYNTAGMVTQELSSLDATPDNTWGETDFTYDATQQFAGATYTNFANPPGSNTAVNYDANENRTSTNGATNASATNRVLFDGTYYFTYDAAGNRTAKYQNSVDPSFDSNATDITIYTWDNKNELLSVRTYDNYSDYTTGTVDAATTAIDYAYDSFGRMVSRTDAKTSTTESFINDGGNIALVLNSDGQVLERELYGPAVDQVLATEYPAISGSGPQSSGTVLWSLPDNQQTIRDVAVYDAGTNTTSVVNHLVYDPSGQITSTTPDAQQPPFTFDGMWQDPTTGLDFSTSSPSWYDAVDGVFASGGPMGGNGGTGALSNPGNPHPPTSPSNPPTDVPGFMPPPDANDDDGKEFTSNPEKIPQADGVGIERESDSISGGSSWASRRRRYASHQYYVPRPAPPPPPVKAHWPPSFVNQRWIAPDDGGINTFGNLFNGGMDFASCGIYRGYRAGLDADFTDYHSSEYKNGGNTVQIAMLGLSAFDLVGSVGGALLRGGGEVAATEGAEIAAETAESGVPDVALTLDEQAAVTGDFLLADETAGAEAGAARFSGSIEEAESLQLQAEELNSLREDGKFGTTCVTNVRNIETGETQTWVATNGPDPMPEEWDGLLQNDEVFIDGPGHAEQTIVNSLGDEWQLMSGGSSRNICSSICEPALDGAGVQLGGPTFPGATDKTPYRMFFRL